MIFIIFALILIIITAAISIYAYRTAFYSPKRDGSKLYQLPQGEQYEPNLPNISKWIDEMLAYPYEEIYISAFDGTKLFARYYHVKDGAPVQIQFHGYRSSSFLDFCGGCKYALKSGYNVLLVDQRAHGKSEGSTITFGINERKDCLSWIDYVCQRFGKDVPIILCGLSMGAATVLMVSDMEFPDNVAGIIADCPYSSPKAIIQEVCKGMHFPPRLTYPFVKLGARLFGHFNIDETSAVAAVKNTRVPILIVHGDDDRFVPCDMSREIRNANTEQITLEIIPGAGHGLCYLTGPKQYETAIDKFLNAILK